MRPRPTPPEAGERTLKKTERSILTVLAQFPSGRTVVQIAMLTGYSHQGGGFRNAIGALRSAGYIDGRDPIVITSEGVHAAGEYEPLPTGPALRDNWRGQLKKAEREILTVVLDAYPNPLTPVQIAANTDTQ